MAVWRTLGNWSRLIKAGTVKLGSVEFIFATNATLAPETAFGMLGEADADRSPELALSLLRAAAGTSQNKETAADRADFLSLTEAQQEAFVSAIRAVTSVGLPDVTGELRNALHFVCEPGQLPEFVAELEGWWIHRISEALGKGEGPLISLLEVDGRIAYLREKYKVSSLQIDDDVEADGPEALDEHTFVQQVAVLKTGPGRIRNAQRDFLRARAQRSRWVREARVDPEEINRYDRSLEDSWRTQFEIMGDEIASGSDDAEKCKAGRELLGWAETQQVPIRGARAQFLTSGSFHGLSDEVRIGWHPDYLDKFGKPK